MSTETFGFGSAVFPLTDDTSNSLIQSADPALAAALDFLPAVLDYELGSALREFAARDGINITNAVLTKLNIEPIPALYADRVRFPVFALYRKSETHTGHTTTWDKSIGEWEFAYVLPPLMPEPQKRLAPILHAVGRVLGKAVRFGSHPRYQEGRNVWRDAGIMSARLVSVRYERYERIESGQQFFRALVGTLEMVERDTQILSAYEPFDGANIQLDVKADDETVLVDVAEIATRPPPTVTNIVPSSGTAAGGTSVTITGTNFRAPVRVVFGGADVEATVVSATTITAITPAHTAYPTFMADVVVVNGDGQTGRLSAGYTFTSP